MNPFDKLNELAAEMILGDDPEKKKLGAEIVTAVGNILDPPKFEMNFSEKATNLKMQVQGTGFLRAFTGSGQTFDADESEGTDGRKALGMGTGTPRIVRMEAWGNGSFWDLEYD